ncbi:MAG: EFR1 family ferrodoxin [Candidatus Omnitrophica bacterium]|nr:EFR1 family ferrodoxin [Candidatus Omnitrophota bacterium]
MKNTIFYFSGTGNCLQLARALAAELSETEIVPIAKAIKENNIDNSAGRIGLIFPVYAFNAPLIVSDFINKMEIGPEKYVFAITTCASLAADTLGDIARKLKKKGSGLCAGFVIKMPGNYTPLAEAIPVCKQNKLFAAALQRIKEIAPIIKEGRRHKIERAKLPFRLAGQALNLFLPNITHSEDRHFRTDEKCNGCGICSKVCPVNNINIVNERPIWLHKCELCFACLQWCPQEAIQYGGNTAGRRRYRNPSVALKDFMQ